MEVEYTYSKANKYYDKNWVINNFGDGFYQENNFRINAYKKKYEDNIYYYWYFYCIISAYLNNHFIN